MTRNDTCACCTPENKEKAITYAEHVTEVTKLSTYIYEKTQKLGDVFFGCKPKKEHVDRDVDALSTFDGITERQTEILTEVNLMLDEILVRLIG